MNNKKKDILLSVAIGDISGVPYEFEGRTKNYNSIDLLRPDNTYSDDSVCTFACAEALLHHLDMASTLYKRGREDFYRGFGGNMARWLISPEVPPAYPSFGNGSAMRCSAAALLAHTEEECVTLATQTALPTHNHPEGIKGAVATALAIYHALQGRNKFFIRQQVLNVFYPSWNGRIYADIKPSYPFNETCQITVPAAIICFLESNDFTDGLKLAISLGGDADTLAAIAAPMACAFYGEMPQQLIDNALKKLPQWMIDINREMNQMNESTK